MKCLHCGTSIEGAAPADPTNDAPPDEGAVFICITCGHLMMLDARDEVRELTNAEMQDVMMDEGLRKALAHIGKSRLA